MIRLVTFLAACLLVGAVHGKADQTNKTGCGRGKDVKKVGRRRGANATSDQAEIEHKQSRRTEALNAVHLSSAIHTTHNTGQVLEALKKGPYYLNGTTHTTQKPCIYIVVKESSDECQTGTPVTYGYMDDGRWENNTVMVNGTGGTFPSELPGPLSGMKIVALGRNCLTLHKKEVQSEETIVYPEFLEERSDNGARTLKLKDDLTLNLVQKSPFPERLHLRTPQRDGSLLNNYVSSSLYSSKLFQDEGKFASFVVTEDDGLQLRGMIGDDWRIEPLATAERSSEGRVAHRLYKVEEERSDTPIFQYVSEPATDGAAGIVSEMVESRLDKTFARAETHIVVDSVLFEQFNKNETDVILYLGAAINSVNLRYKTIKTLDIEIAVVGFTFYNNTDEEQHFVIFESVQNGSKPDFSKTLSAFKGFYKKNHSNIFYKVDLLSFLTGRDMCLIKGGVVNCGIAGVATVAGVCVEGRSSVVEDKAWSFSVVIRLAHEFAHNLGCVHDGSPPLTNVNGHPGAETCPWNDGFLMSYITNDKHFQFSNCCAEQIHFISRLEEKLCLYYNNSDSSDRVETDALPGDLVSLDKYCELTFAHLTDYQFKFDNETGIKAGCVVPCVGKSEKQGATQVYGAIDQLEGSPCDPYDKDKVRYSTPLLVVIRGMK
ncbi:venom metalloproteinase antarease TserMP_A-like isoform X2 [Ornithodoros turicata]|uniref:venom metalloproteinase antarease TserMP_A-like isoform X2 n=1 Tax=Ornithodoros turicata TaxID=34597 RepID=UPI003139386A